MPNSGGSPRDVATYHSYFQTPRLLALRDVSTWPKDFPASNVSEIKMRPVARRCNLFASFQAEPYGAVRQWLRCSPWCINGVFPITTAAIATHARSRHAARRQLQHRTRDSGGGTCVNGKNHQGPCQELGSFWNSDVLMPLPSTSQQGADKKRRVKWIVRTYYQR